MNKEEQQWKNGSTLIVNLFLKYGKLSIREDQCWRIISAGSGKELGKIIRRGLSGIRRGIARN